MTKDVSFKRPQSKEDNEEKLFCNLSESLASEKSSSRQSHGFKVEGTPEYDINHGEIFCGVYPGEKANVPSKNSAVTIKMVYPDREFFTQNTEFESRHKSMQAEADEHYKYLLAMQKVDSDFDRMLYENHSRKKLVENALYQSKTWHRFAKKISPSMN